MAMVSASGMFCRPASVTKPERSECAENSPSTPASAQRACTMSGCKEDRNQACELRRQGLWGCTEALSVFNTMCIMLNSARVESFVARVRCVCHWSCPFHRRASPLWGVSAVQHCGHMVTRSRPRRNAISTVRLRSKGLSADQLRFWVEGQGMKWRRDPATGPANPFPGDHLKSANAGAS